MLPSTRRFHSTDATTRLEPCFAITHGMRRNEIVESSDGFPALYPNVWSIERMAAGSGCRNRCSISIYSTFKRFALYIHIFSLQHGSKHPFHHLKVHATLYQKSRYNKYLMQENSSASHLFSLPLRSDVNCILSTEKKPKLQARSPQETYFPRLPRQQSEISNHEIFISHSEPAAVGCTKRPLSP